MNWPYVRWIRQSFVVTFLKPKDDDANHLNNWLPLQCSLKNVPFYRLRKNPLDSKLWKRYRWLLCVLLNWSIDKLPVWFLIFKGEHFSHLHLNASTKSRIRQLPGNLEWQFLLKRLEVKICIHLLNWFCDTDGGYEMGMKSPKNKI